MMDSSTINDLREVLRRKARAHSLFYNNISQIGWLDEVIPNDATKKIQDQKSCEYKPNSIKSSPKTTMTTTTNVTTLINSSVTSSSSTSQSSTFSPSSSSSLSVVGDKDEDTKLLTTKPLQKRLLKNINSDNNDDRPGESVNDEGIINIKMNKLSKKIPEIELLSPLSQCQRHRKAVVYTFSNESNEDSDDLVNRKFPCVEKLVEMYSSMINLKQNKSDKLLSTSSSSASSSPSSVGRNFKTHSTSEQFLSENKNNLFKKLNDRRSPVSDESCLASMSTYYSSDDDDNSNSNLLISEYKKRDKVLRSSSSDSALGLDDDLMAQEFQTSGGGGEKRRFTLTVNDIPLRPALLPLAEPNKLPTTGDSPRTITPPIPIDLCPVRSKMILEGKIIELHDFDGNQHATSASSRRESLQSTQSVDDFSAVSGNKVRYMRTPSVVVSDYSDEIMSGLTLEEIEYFSQHRLKRRASYDDCSDLSAASSCSNLNYCGSHISLLDELSTPERKISSCSTCSVLSDDENQQSFGQQLNQALEQHQAEDKKPKKKIES